MEGSGFLFLFSSEGKEQRKEKTGRNDATVMTKQQRGSTPSTKGEDSQHRGRTHHAEREDSQHRGVGLPAQRGWIPRTEGEDSQNRGGRTPSTEREDSRHRREGLTAQSGRTPSIQGWAVFHCSSTSHRQNPIRWNLDVYKGEPNAYISSMALREFHKYHEYHSSHLVRTHRLD